MFISGSGEGGETVLGAGFGCGEGGEGLGILILMLIFMTPRQIPLRFKMNLE